MGKNEYAYRVKVDEVTNKNDWVSDIIKQALLKNGFEIDVDPLMNEDGRQTGELLHVYDIRHINIE